MKPPRVESPSVPDDAPSPEVPETVAEGDVARPTGFFAKVSEWWAIAIAWVTTPRGRLIVGGGATTVIIAVAAVVFVGMRVEVPNLIGLTDNEASNVVSAAGLSWADSNVSWQSNVPHEFQVVAEQSPPPGEVVWRDTEAIITMHPETVTMPRVVDLSFEEAEAVLSDVGLRLDTEFKEEPRALEWRVLSQDVAAGEPIDAWSVIALELDVPQINVPSLVGMTLISAKIEAEEAGFVVRWDPAEADNDWEVLSQSLTAGDVVRFGTAVELGVARPLVLVPSVLGLSQNQAIEAIGDAGLVIVFSPAGADSNWSIASQSPVAGSAVRQGTTVTVTLREPRIVYSVTGNGSRAAITWTIPGTTGSIAQDGNAGIPWSISFPYTTGYTSLLAQMLNGSSITCTITVNGVITKQVTSTGQFAIAMCG